MVYAAALRMDKVLSTAWLQPGLQLRQNSDGFSFPQLALLSTSGPARSSIIELSDPVESELRIRMIGASRLKFPEYVRLMRCST